FRCACACARPLPHSFPTRRSSDLAFAIGFGPEIWGRYDRNGCRWKICAVPFGGYVKFHGDAGVASDAAEGIDEMPEEEKKVSFQDRKSTRLNSSHVKISYAVFCLK